jgi:glycosyltransferase involved in cell wall biosynthesis
MISVAIPTYESHGQAEEFAKFQFEKFLKQTYKDFEIVISDHSRDDVIKNICDEYKNEINIVYVRNEKGRGLSSYNINNAMEHCNGEIIKFLWFDDFLWDNYSLQFTHEAFHSNTNWLVSACEHTKDDGKTFYRTFYPQYNDQIYLGNNTISSPSVLSIRNTKDKIYFDDRLIWLMDVDYYKRLYDKYGLPTILNKITIVNRDHAKQLSHVMDPKVKEREYHMMVEKHT